MGDDSQQREAAERLVQALQCREEAIATWEQAKKDARGAGVSLAMGAQTAIDAGIRQPELILEIQRELGL